MDCQVEPHKTDPLNRMIKPANTSNSSLRGSIFRMAGRSTASAVGLRAFMACVGIILGGTDRSLPRPFPLLGDSALPPEQPRRAQNTKRTNRAGPRPSHIPTLPAVGGRRWLCLGYRRCG